MQNNANSGRPVRFGVFEVDVRTGELRKQHVGGVTIFRHRNVASPAQVRLLTAALQRAAAESGQPPLVIGADQEGGTLLAIAGTTPSRRTCAAAGCALTLPDRVVRRL